MPSDVDRLDVVRKALSPLWAGYREAAVLAADEVDSLLRGARAAATADHARALAATLGPLGASHIDVDRLAPLLGEESVLSGATLEAAQSASAVLRAITRDPDPGPVTLPAGESLAGAVGKTLARIGRVFGAAHVVALARAGRFDPSAHAPWLEAYPFSRWNRRERRLAPPVLVSLEGSDLRAGGLAEFLDGAVKLALVVRDDVSPPAPLVRLLTPGLYLAQTHDGSEMTPLAAWPGPGVVAWVPSCAAAFVHDPAAGPTLGARFKLLSTPSAPRHGVGGQSATQLAEELSQLESIAGLATLGGAAVPPGAAGEASPVDKLAAWILSQASPAGTTVESGT
jgi:hypothetical protein